MRGKIARTALPIFVVIAAACAPVIDAPAAAQRAADRDDAARLTAALAALPGVETAHVELHRVAADPLAPAPPDAAALVDVARAAAVVTVDSAEARERVTIAAAALLSTTGVPSPTVLVQLGEPRPALASVGPFTVAASSRGPLRALLAVALAAIAALGAVVALRYRRGNSAQ